MARCHGRETRGWGIHGCLMITLLSELWDIGVWVWRLEFVFYM